MDNNEILIRLRNGLHLKDSDMAEIFRLGGINPTMEEMKKMLLESEEPGSEAGEENGRLKCGNFELESFLNGFILFKRGEEDSNPEKDRKPSLSITHSGKVNNVMLKKLKIALSLTGDDMIDVLRKGGVIATKRDLSPFFRIEGHKHYRKCGDVFARGFLKGLAKKNQG